MGEARDHDALVRQHLIPDSERKPMDQRPAVAEGVGHDLILERVLADAGERAADLLGEAIAEAGFARFVVVLRPRDVSASARGVNLTGRFKERDDGAGAVP